MKYKIIILLLALIISGEARAQHSKAHNRPRAFTPPPVSRDTDYFVTERQAVYVLRVPPEKYVVVADSEVLVARRIDVSMMTETGTAMVLDEYIAASSQARYKDEMTKGQTPNVELHVLIQNGRLTLKGARLTFRPEGSAQPMQFSFNTQAGSKDLPTKLTEIKTGATWLRDDDAGGVPPSVGG